MNKFIYKAIYFYLTVTRSIKTHCYVDVESPSSLKYCWYRLIFPICCCFYGLFSSFFSLFLVQHFFYNQFQFRTHFTMLTLFTLMSFQFTWVFCDRKSVSSKEMFFRLIEITASVSWSVSCHAQTKEIRVLVNANIDCLCLTHEDIRTCERQTNCYQYTFLTWFIMALYSFCFVLSCLCILI